MMAPVTCLHHLLHQVGVGGQSHWTCQSLALHPVAHVHPHCHCCCCCRCGPCRCACACPCSSSACTAMLEERHRISQLLYVQLGWRYGGRVVHKSGSAWNIMPRSCYELQGTNGAASTGCAKDKAHRVGPLHTHTHMQKEKTPTSFFSFFFFSFLSFFFSFASSLCCSPCPSLSFCSHSRAARSRAPSRSCSQPRTPEKYH